MTNENQHKDIEPGARSGPPGQSGVTGTNAEDHLAEFVEGHKSRAATEPRSDQEPDHATRTADSESGGESSVVASNAQQKLIYRRSNSEDFEASTHRAFLIHQIPIVLSKLPTVLYASAFLVLAASGQLLAMFEMILGVIAAIFPPK